MKFFFFNELNFKLNWINDNWFLNSRKQLAWLNSDNSGQQLHANPVWARP